MCRKGYRQSKLRVFVQPSKRDLAVQRQGWLVFQPAVALAGTFRQSAAHERQPRQ